mgnify:CR=1 FL=1
MKEMVVGPKVEPTEPACINDPNTGELITNKENIKSTSLAHCVKILAKNPIRDCDRNELKMKEDNHKLIMGKSKRPQKKDTLDQGVLFSETSCGSRQKCVIFRQHFL